MLTSELYPSTVSSALLKQDRMEDRNETRNFSGSSFSQIIIMTVMAIEILSLPLNSLYQELLGKNAAPTHFSVSWSVLAVEAIYQFCSQWSTSENLIKAEDNMLLSAFLYGG